MLIAAPISSASRPATLTEALSTIDSQLENGDWKKAREHLERIPVSLRDHYWSLLWAISDNDGMRSYSLLKGLLAEDPPPPISCRAVEGLAEFHLLRENYALGLAQINEHLSDCNSSDRHGRLLKLKGEHLLKVELPDKAARSFQDALVAENSPRTNAETILALGLARSQQRKFQEADYIYTRLTRSLSGNHNALAIERLREIRNQVGDTLGAATLNDLLDKTLASAGHTKKQDETSLVGGTDATPSVYAIRVGEFESEDKAESLLQRFREDGYTVELTEASVAGTTVYTVDLGRFKSALRAERFMLKLQRQTNGTYQVVSL